MPRNPVVVVGAGLAGLAAATQLRVDGVAAIVLEKSHHVGGRMATWRSAGSAGAVCDTGAQFFTVRGDEFREHVDAWLAAGLAHEWCRGFGDPPDGYPRYAGRGGMDRVAEALAEGARVRTGARVEAVMPSGSGWRVELGGGESLPASAVALATPVPAAARLLDAPLPEVAYDPTLAVVAALDRAPVIPPPGGVQLDEGPFSFVADNAAKGISERPAVTLHASAALSRDRWSEPDERLLTELLTAARPWLGPARVVDANLRRWRYATPRTIQPAPCLIAATDPAPLVLAGDAWAGPRVEGAFCSGLAAGRALSEAVA